MCPHSRVIINMCDNEHTMLQCTCFILNLRKVSVLAERFAAEGSLPTKRRSPSQWQVLSAQCA